jgi:hypothetical protein
MALATSGTINLTDIRDFYGLSGSINLTNLHKGENGVPDPATYAVSNFTQMNAASAPAFPLAVYDNVSLSSQASSSGYWGGTTMEPGSRKGFYGSNYADATGTSGYNDNYAQLVSVAASAWLGSTFSAHAEITFQVSHTGIYSLYGLHIANGASNGGLMTINGSGVSIKDQSGSSVTAGSNLDLTANSAGRFFEVTLPASTTITLRAVTVSGSGGSWLLAQLRTNCNHQRGDNSDNSSSTTNNNMLTQG